MEFRDNKSVDICRIALKMSISSREEEKKLIKENPVDREGRMIKLLYTNLDLTEIGQKILYDLYNKWLTYTDKNDADSLKRARNIKQLEKYYQKLVG